MLIVMGLVLLWADARTGKRTVDESPAAGRAGDGGGTALALQPGVSRSGVTDHRRPLLGFDRRAAARISFLMSLVITAGARGCSSSATSCRRRDPDGF